MIRHYVYVITDQQTRQYYIGLRSTNQTPETDNYSGSGVWCRQNRVLHGKKYLEIDRFSKTILKTFDNRESASRYENEYLKNYLYVDPLCMNRIPGGDLVQNTGTKHFNYDKNFYAFFDFLSGEKIVTTQHHLRIVYGLAPTDTTSLIKETKIKVKNLCLYKNIYKVRHGKGLMNNFSDKKLYDFWDITKQEKFTTTKYGFCLRNKIKNDNLNKLFSGDIKSLSNCCLYENKDYKKPVKKYIFYDGDKDEYVTMSRKELMKEYNIMKSSLSYLIRGRISKVKNIMFVKEI